MAMIKCPKCGKDISDKAKACPSCGYNIAIHKCPECGTMISEQDSICKNCGCPIKHSIDISKAVLKVKKKAEGIGDAAKELGEKTQAKIKNVDVEECKGKVKSGIENAKKYVIANKKNKKFLGIIAGSILVIALAVVLLASSSAKAAAKSYTKSVLSGDLKTMDTYAYISLKEFLTDGWDEDDFEDAGENLDEDVRNWNQLCKALKNVTKEAYEDAFGDYKITVEPKKDKKISLKKFYSESGVSEYDLETMDIDPDKLKNIRQVTLKVKISGDDADYKFNTVLYLAKKGLAWRIIAEDFSDASSKIKDMILDLY